MGEAPEQAVNVSPGARRASPGTGSRIYNGMSHMRHADANEEADGLWAVSGRIYNGMSQVRHADAIGGTLQLPVVRWALGLVGGFFEPLKEWERDKRP